MDYEKKYKEAMKACKELSDTFDNETLTEELEKIFPELKESEDERIRKVLKEYFINSFQINGVAAICGVHIKDIIAWLEKQGEQPKKPADKVEPKFHEGDWVVQGYNILKIKCVGDTRYCFETVVGYVDDMLVSEIDSQFHLWSIQDAKDGDVLYLQKDGKEHIIIYKGVIKERFRTFVSAYCAYNGIVDAFCFADVSRYVDIAYRGIMPATKEQRDLLFQKMKEEGYEWDAEKKELKKIEQKTAWSKDDEIALGDALWCCKQAASIAKDENDMGNIWYAENWLKSIKDRVQPQPKQEWSEEDEYNQAWIIEMLYGLEDEDKEYEKKCRKMAEWLKSLRPHWKPSEEMLEALYRAIPENVMEISEDEMLLDKLYQGLKYGRVLSNK